MRSQLAVVVSYFKEFLRRKLGEEPNRSLDRSNLIGVSADLAGGTMLSSDKSVDSRGTDLKHGLLPSKKTFDAWKKEDVGSRKYAETKD